MQNIAFMPKVKTKAGRPRKKESEKVKVVSAYLKLKEEKAINNKYGNITEALRVEVLPKCG